MSQNAKFPLNNNRTSCLSYCLLLFFLVLHLNGAQGQDVVSEEAIKVVNNNSGFQFGVNAGYDWPSYTKDFTYYKTDPGLKFGATMDYNFGMLGLGVDYDYLGNGAASAVNESFFSDSLLVNSLTKTDMSESITRHFIGIGPNFNYGLGDMLNLKAYLRGGYGIVAGGELVTTTPAPAGSPDSQVLFAGIDGSGLAAKGGITLGIKLMPNLGVTLGGYYLNHFSVHTDTEFELNNQGDIGIVYGHSPFVDSGSSQYIGPGSAFVVNTPGEADPPCAPYKSFGVTAGLRYVFGSNPKKKDVCNNCGCPDDGHKVVVTVKDEISGKIIPEADVAIKDINGDIIATGTTNSFGVVDFGEIPHGNYYIDGLVYGVETSTTDLVEDDFQPDAIIRKEVLYTDMRFILKGKVVNKNTRAAEPGVAVSLTNTRSRNVNQATSDGQGAFGFQLDKSSSYEIVGIKENRLSEIARASTMGLNRSTTLFVDLELGVENFECGRGTVLDIKYEFDKDVLLTESKFHLDKLVRYMQAHNVSRVELSSHTDSRGSDVYNQDLSQRRAQSATNYIVSKGISLSRIIAKGYGETRLTNRCADGVSCSEEEHRVNRRTEAKLLCN